MNSFLEIGLNDQILQALEDLNFVKPTPIQAKTLGLLLHTDQDLMGLAQTGTGKTAAFSLPIIQQIDPTVKGVQAIILCPTRELCLQIGKDIQSYAKYLSGVRPLCIYGGSSIERQIKALKSGCNIVVGTPGRTLDMIRRRKLRLQWVKWMVLDEADEMLNMGFQEDLNAILSHTPEAKQTLLFSATMPPEISLLAQTYMRDPIEVSAGHKNRGTKNVSHQYFFSAPRDRYGTLKSILDSTPNIYAIIFCRTRKETKDVASKLRKQGYSADALHGELTQAQRDKVMGKFRRRQLQLMVATDVAARGLDVDNLTHVINFNLPDELDAYIHRSGRTGRAGQKGISIAIIHSREKKKLARLEKKIDAKFTEGILPSASERALKRLFQYLSEVEKTEVDSLFLLSVLPELSKKIEWLSKEDLLAKVLMQEMNRQGLTGEDDYSTKIKKKKKTAKRDKPKVQAQNGHAFGFKNSSRFNRFYINLGAKQKIDPVSLMALLNQQMRDDSFEIGEIEIFRSFSFFEIEQSFSEKLLSSFRKAIFRGTKIKLKLAAPKRQPV